MKPHFFFAFLYSLSFNSHAEFFYCYAQSIEGDNYFYSPVFEGQFEQLACYQNAFDDYLEKTQQYAFRPTCTFEENADMLTRLYHQEMADSAEIYGEVSVLSWHPTCGKVVSAQ